MTIIPFHRGPDVGSGEFFEILLGNYWDLEEGWFLSRDFDEITDEGIVVKHETIDFEPVEACPVNPAHEISSRAIPRMIDEAGTPDRSIPNALTACGSIHGPAYADPRSAELIRTSDLTGVDVCPMPDSKFDLSFLNIAGRFVPDLFDVPANACCLECRSPLRPCEGCGVFDFECASCGKTMISTDETSFPAPFLLPYSKWRTRVLDVRWWKGDDFFPIVGGVACTLSAFQFLERNTIVPFLYRPLRHGGTYTLNVNHWQ